MATYKMFAGDIIKFGGGTSKIMFLDDDASRHTVFAQTLDKRGVDHVMLYRAWNAKEAIALLKNHVFDQVFLDHDLSYEEQGQAIQSLAASQQSVPTGHVHDFENPLNNGMTVVDYICQMEQPCQDIIVHSLNGPARDEMCRRLQDKGLARVRNLPFTELLMLLDPRFGVRF